MKLSITVDDKGNITGSASPYRGSTSQKVPAGTVANFMIVPGQGRRLVEVDVPDQLADPNSLAAFLSQHVLTWEQGRPVLGPRQQDAADNEGRSPQEQQPDDQQSDSDASIPKIYGPDYDGSLRPLVFVPGILGSSIRRRGSVEYLWPPATVDGQGHFQVLQHLQDLARPGVAKEATREFPVVYAPLLDFLKSLRGTFNLHPFWYDWTQSNRKSGEQLAAHIDKVLALPLYAGKFDQVDLVCHSMGGLVTRAAAILNGAAPKIRRTAYLASPHYGAPKAYFVLHPSIDFNVVEGFFYGLIADVIWKLYIQGPEDEKTIELEMRKLAEQMDSVFELLPDQFYLDKNVLITDRYIGTSYPIHGLPGTYYSNDWKWPDPLATKVKVAMALKAALGGTVPGDEDTTLVLYSNTEPTLDAINYYHQFGSGFGSPRSSDPNNGDQTVPARSATANDTAPNRDSVPGEHVALVNNPPTHLKVGRFLQRPPA